MTSLSELPTYHAPVLYVIDHDSTRGLTRAAMARLKYLATHTPYYLDITKLEAAHQEAKASALPFDALRYIRDELASKPELFSRFKADFTDGDPREVVYPEVPHFDEALNTFPAIPHLILTAGSPEFQKLKLAASGYDGYVKIVPIDDTGHTAPKGPVIAGWQADDGSFEVLGMDQDGQPVARYIAGRAHLIDDKAISFQGLPTGSTGSYVTHESFGDIRVTSQGTAADLPPGVEQIDNLSEIVIERGDVPAQDSPAELVRSFVPLFEYANQR